MRARACAVLAVTAACHSSPSHGRDADEPNTAPMVAIVGATLVHPGRDGADLTEADQTVIITNDRITAIGPADTLTPPPGAMILDGHGRWLMPGLIDSHVHFFQSGDPFTRPDIANFTATVPYAQEVARNKARLPATFAVWLASGVTSVVDCGGPMWNFEVRASSQQTPLAPRVAVAGPLVATTSSHLLDLDDPPFIEVTTPADASALVTRELASDPDFIKVFFIHNPSRDISIETGIVSAAIDTAHAGGKRVLVHATDMLTAKAAMNAGADILVHSTLADVVVDNEFIQLAQDHHVMLMPTLQVDPGYWLVLAGKYTPTDEEQRLADPEILQQLALLPATQTEPAAVPPQAAMDSLPIIWNAGIPVALGTDAGNIGTLHGPGVFREARWMVQAGLTPAQVLRSATVNGAAVLGMEADLGDVAVGKLADLVLLDGDPTISIDNWSHATAVIRGGYVYDPAVLMALVTATM